MKITISLPDNLSEAANKLATKLGIPRSQLYARAVSEYLARHRQSDVTERLNTVYGEGEAHLDPVLQELQFRSFASAGDEW